MAHKDFSALNHCQHSFFFGGGGGGWGKGVWGQEKDNKFLQMKIIVSVTLAVHRALKEAERI